MQERTIDIHGEDIVDVERHYTFDGVFGPECSQETVFRLAGTHAPAGPDSLRCAFHA